MKKKDQALLEEAYQKVLETNLEIRDQYGDVIGREPTDNDRRNYETNKQLEDDARRKKEHTISKWTLKSFSAIGDIKKDIENSARSANIFDLRDLKPNDKKSRDFILSLAKKELSSYPDILKQVDPDKILTSYRTYVDPALQKADREKEEKQQAQNIQQRSSRSADMSSTIKKLEQVGFQRGKPYKDETGVTVTPMTKTIGSLLGGRQNTTVTVNPDGTIFKGQDVESWLTGSGKHFAKGKKSLF